MKTYYIVKGEVTDPEAYECVAHQMGGKLPELGQTEWQFSDGLPGDRGSSADFLSLEAGLSALSPAIFIWVG
jgi:hypothetical protein